jgi:hypothetical protein
LFANGSANLLQAAELFNTIPMPQNTPLSVLTQQPGATPQSPSIFNQSGKEGLRVSLDGNKIEMSGPQVTRIVTALERIDDNLAFE